MYRSSLVNQNAPSGADAVGGVACAITCIKPLCDTVNSVFKLLSTTVSGVCADDVICAPAVTLKVVVAFLIRKKSDSSEGVGVVLVKVPRPIKNRDPVAANDPVNCTTCFNGSTYDAVNVYDAVVAVVAVKALPVKFAVKLDEFIHFKDAELYTNG